MITNRKIAAVTFLALSFVAAVTVLGFAPATTNDSKVSITAQQQPSGETMTVVTVVAKRLHAKDKIAATFAAKFADARDAMVTHAQS